jgi:hypothetical protein
MRISILTMTLAATTLGVLAEKKKKVAYEFPAAMAPQVQAEYGKLCDKGQILYEINCARCHNQKEKSKELIPDFTPEQLKGYEIRVTNAQHEGALLEEKVTAEELALICVFLTYKKKSGLPGMPVPLSKTAQATSSVAP